MSMNREFKRIDRHMKRVQDLKEEIRECEKAIRYVKYAKILSLTVKQHLCKTDTCFTHTNFKLSEPDKQFHADLIKVFSDYKKRLIAELDNVLKGIGCEPYQDEEEDT